MRNRGGFTVVESLIALSISAALFVFLMAVFSGRQGRVEFSQGIRDIESYIQDIANDVRNGYYPNISSQKCGYDDASSVIKFDTIPSNQGTSDTCIFAGKVLLLDSSTTTSVISVYPIVGLNKKQAIVANISELKLALLGINGDEAKIDYTMPGRISLVDSNLLNTRALIGFLFDVTGVGLSGTKKITNVTPYIIPIGGVDLTAIKNGVSATASYIPITTGRVLCFRGANNQTGVISVRKGPDGLTTSVQIGQTISAATGCI